MNQQAIQVEGEIVDEAPQVVSTALVRQVEQAQVDSQIATAKRYPRNITGFKQKMLTYAKQSKDVAASCFYKKPVAGGYVEGESVRFAEMAALAWGNLRFGSRVTEIAHDRVTASGFCMDLETNVGETAEVTMSILRKNGTRYSNEQIDTIASAVQAKARRNAILSVIPRSMFQSVVDELWAFLEDERAKALPEERDYALKYLRETFKLDEKRVFAAIGVPSKDDIDVGKLGELRARFQAVKEREVTLEEAFPPLAPPAAKTAEVAAEIKKKASKEEPKSAAEAKT